MLATTTVGFDEAGLLDRLEAMTVPELDALDFGVIAFGPDRIVTLYNAPESRFAGLQPGRVIGRHLFEEVAPCLNNFMVSQRFDDEPELDDTIPFVLTLRMRPTPVRLRLLQRPGLAQSWLLVQRRTAG